MSASRRLYRRLRTHSAESMPRAEPEALAEYEAISQCLSDNNCIDDAQEVDSYASSIIASQITNDALRRRLYPWGRPVP